MKRGVERGSRMKRYIASYMKKHGVYYALVAPYMILFTIFVVVPVIISIYYSFTYYNMLEPARFLGADNYIRLFTQDDVFLTALKNTVIIAGITGPVSFFLCFFLAWLINDFRPFVRALFTLAFYIPTITTSMYTIWIFVFHGSRYGILNSILLNLNLIDVPIVFLRDPKYMMMVLIVVTLWMSLGTSFLAFIAGFQGLDKSLFEAAAVEGISNRWQELWYITLPIMRPQLMFGAVMQITAAFSVGDVGNQLLGFPSIDYATHTILNHLYDYGSVRFELSYSSAIATLLFFMMVGTNKAVNKLLSKVGR